MSLIPPRSYPPRQVLAMTHTLLAQTMACPCDQPERGIPLCVQCACLFSVLVAAINWEARQLAPHAAYWQPPALED